jgi:hypothetical protein
MLSVVVLTLSLLPQIPTLAAGRPLPMPLWAITLLSLAQSGVLLGLAVLAGNALAPAVGLGAPVFTAAVTGRPAGPVLRPQILPGIIAGLLGGGFLLAAWRTAPAVLVPVQEHIRLPLFARVLYGGITEELLLRWGFMTVLVWLAWTFLQRRRSAPAPGLVRLAIVVSAVVFGAGHLPAASMLAGSLDAAAVAWVVGVNTVFGLLFGYLYWRRGLESAMIAHGLTHAVHYLAELL